MKCLFLDDERDPKDVTWILYPAEIKTWEVIRSYDAAISWIEVNGLPDFISFDNDLGELDGKEGFHLAQYIVMYCLNHKKSFPSCAIHSKNPIAADRILSLIKSFKKNCENN